MKREKTEAEKELEIWKKACMKMLFAHLNIENMIHNGTLILNAKQNDGKISSELIDTIKQIEKASHVSGDVNTLVSNDEDWQRLGTEYYEEN